MKQQITHISIHQTSKVLALLYFLPLAILMIPLGLFFLWQGNNAEAFFYFLLPIFYPLVMYIFASLLLWFYNKIAHYFGGIEFTLTQKD